MTSSVNYEIAYQLREQGFDRPCSGFYYEKCAENDAVNISGTYESMQQWSRGRVDTNSLSSHDFIIIAPTIAEVVMWFLEEHKTWIQVEMTYPGLWESTIYRTNSVLPVSGLSKQQTSPIKAYEQAISHFLLILPNLL